LDADRAPQLKAIVRRLLVMRAERFSTKPFLKVLAIFVVLLSLACDRLIEYSPQDWAKSGQRRFSKTVGLIDVEITPLGGIIGNEHLIPEVALHNRARLPVVIEGAILKAHGVEYVARPFGEASWEIVPPNETRKITLEWELGKPLYEVLKDPVELNLTIKVGNERTEIRVPMVKTFG
jgi:hypothetical protein